MSGSQTFKNNRRRAQGGNWRNSRKCVGKCRWCDCKSHGRPEEPWHGLPRSAVRCKACLCSLWVKKRFCLRRQTQRPRRHRNERCERWSTKRDVGVVTSTLWVWTKNKQACYLMCPVSGEQTLLAFTENWTSISGWCFDWRWTRQSPSPSPWAWATPSRLMKCFQREKHFPECRHLALGFRQTKRDRSPVLSLQSPRNQSSLLYKLYWENSGKARKMLHKMRLVSKTKKLTSKIALCFHFVIIQIIVLENDETSSLPLKYCSLFVLLLFGMFHTKLHSFKFIQFTVIIANVSAVSDISGMHMKLNAADDWLHSTYMAFFLFVLRSWYMNR